MQCPSKRSQPWPNRNTAHFHGIFFRFTLTCLFRYEDYLDSLVTAVDLFYLEDMALARQLIEFG